MKHVTFAPLLAILLLPAHLSAQDFGSIRDRIRRSFQDNKEAQRAGFEEFKKKQWENFKVLKGEDPYEKPKTPTIPKAPPEPKKPVVEPEKPTTPPVEPEKPEIEPQEPEKVPPRAPELPQATFNFYGTSIKIPYQKEMKISGMRSPSEDAITGSLDRLTSTDSQETIEQLKDYRDSLKLNDWGFYLLAYNLADRLTSTKNDATMLTWYFLTQSGYDTKVAFNNRDLFLFTAIDHQVYQTSFLKEGNRRYFIMDPSGRKFNIGSIRTFRGSYPRSDTSMSYLMKDTIFPDSTKDRVLTFNYRNKNYSLKTSYNQNKVAYYEYSPQTEFDLYFKAPVEVHAKETLLTQLSPLVKGRSELDAVNFLLSFVQKSFAYQTDDQQFKREKPLFPEETLHYPYSDCEDRSIMFAYLVRNLLNLKVVAIHYPGHLATAVLFHGNVSGDTVKYRGTTYVVTDPTYIGASAGMAMPQFKNSSYEIVDF